MSIGDLPVIISCASLALADAGIMMYDLVAAVSLVCICHIFSHFTLTGNYFLLSEHLLLVFAVICCVWL